MSQPPIAPPPPTSLPEQESLYRDSKYQRRRSPIAFWALIIGLILGISGGLAYAWLINPVQETNTRPDQLQREDKSYYVVAIMLAFNYDSDLNLAVERLLAMNLGTDPIGEVAEMACDLARTGYVDSTAGLRAVRAMRNFYQLQGRSGCADTIIPDPQSVPLEITIEVPTPTQTLPPPPTKTASANIASPTPSGLVIVPTTPPQRTYEGFVFRTYCDVELSGTIEVRVRSGGNQGISGERVRVQWDGGSSNFVTGLKPERGVGYADFQMERDVSYIISILGGSDPIAQTILANRCFTENGDEATTSYEIIFTRVG
jgi:hypothetical protein